MTEAREMERQNMDGAGKDEMVRFSGDLDIQRAGELRSTLLEALERSESVSLEFGECAKVDLSFVQMLCSAHRTATKLHKRFRLNGSLPEGFLKAVEDTGYSRTSGCTYDKDGTCLWVGLSRKKKMDASASQY
jgi:anti-anti-sigma regulatory factor